MAASVAEIAGVSRRGEEEAGAAGAALSGDLVREVFQRVDAATLATAACVSSDFRAIAAEESLWEKRCNERWPSTEGVGVKAILASMGGYKRLYAECFPGIVNRELPVLRDENQFVSSEDCDLWRAAAANDDASAADPSNFVSLVDVVYGGRSVFARTVDGIPEADDFRGRFSTCPFRMNLLKEAEDELPPPLWPWDAAALEQSAAVVIDDDLPAIGSVETERKDGKFWSALWDNLRVSCILIDRRTRRMANLTSWTPLGGMRDWPWDKDFFIRFGSVLPAARDAVSNAVQCSIVLKCRASSAEAETKRTTLRLTELTMRLENMSGASLNGKESLAILHGALGCAKSRHHADVLESYHRYLKVQGKLKERRTRQEGPVDIAAVVLCISVCLFVCSLLILTQPK